MANGLTRRMGQKSASTVSSRRMYDDRHYIHKVTNPDPANNKEIGTVPEMGISETTEAIDAADKAFKTWGKTTAKVSDRLLKTVQLKFNNAYV